MISRIGTLKSVLFNMCTTPTKLAKVSYNNINLKQQHTVL